MSGSKLLEAFEVMPVDVYQGGCGHIVLCQEHSSEKEEFYLRVMINERDAEKIAAQILAIAKEIRSK